MTQELRRLAEAATQGKRHYWVNKRAGGTHVQLSAGENDLCCRIEIASTTRADIEYIAAANPAAILELLDRLEKAEKDAKRWKFVQDNIYSLPYDDHGAGPEFDFSNETIDNAMEASK